MGEEGEGRGVAEIQKDTLWAYVPGNLGSTAVGCNTNDTDKMLLLTPTPPIPVPLLHPPSHPDYFYRNKQMRTRCTAR